MFQCDFYIPSHKLVLELNGQDHFYPYTKKNTQRTLLKSVLLRHNHEIPNRDMAKYNLVNLNNFTLNGLQKDPHRLTGLFLNFLRDYE